MWNDTKRLRILLAIAFIARLFFSMRFSYLHPDEHLQGPQEIAHGSFGWASQSPWEFTDEHPLRSYIVLWLVYGIPMGFFTSDSDPVYVMYILRALFFALTWVLEDMAVDRLANTRNDKLRYMFFVSTSYVTWTWQAHTLSNSLETILVLWFLVILHEAESATLASFMSPLDRHYDMFVAALIIVVGMFNRPTFLAFLLLPSLRLLRIWRKNLGTFVTFTVSALVVAGVCIYTDTLLYGSEQWVITPLNFVRYNMSSNNLSEHGTHHRLTHLLANIPLLVGPGLLLLRPKLLFQWRTLKSMPVLAIISGLTLLSYFPHQEARFLLPLVPLICMQMDLDHITMPSLKWVLLYGWMGFNLVLGLLMGVFHQAGVVPAQSQIRHFARPSTVIWWKTYTPPLWLTGLPESQVRYGEMGSYGMDLAGAQAFLAADNSGGDVMTVFDLQGSPVDTLREALHTAQQRSGELYLVAPLAKAAVLQSEFSLNSTLWFTRFHWDPDLVDLDHLDTLRPGLGIWRVAEEYIK